MKISILVLALSLFVMACQSNNKTESGGAMGGLLAPSEFESKFAATAGAQLVDVRTPEEFNGGSLPKAVNIDYKAADFKDRMAKLDKDKPVFVFCQGGVRSAKASAVCKDLGFKEVYDMDGGYNAWKGQ